MGLYLWFSSMGINCFLWHILDKTLLQFCQFNINTNRGATYNCNILFFAKFYNSVEVKLLLWCLDSNIYCSFVNFAATQHQTSGKSQENANSNVKAGFSSQIGNPSVSGCSSKSQQADRAAPSKTVPDRAPGQAKEKARPVEAQKEKQQPKSGS